MRNKIVLIKGHANIAPQITLGEYERINADHIALIVALKRPQFLPPRTVINPHDTAPTGYELDPTCLLINVKKLLEHWKLIEQDHLLASEYAAAVVDIGQDSIRAVEGECLKVSWFFELVKHFHKTHNHKVVETEILSDHPKGVRLVIGNRDYPVKEAVELLRPNPQLG